MRDIRDFDHPDYLNEDGTVTIRLAPSNWHRYNISPDTYQSFTGDSFVEGELEWFNSDESSLESAFGPEYADLSGYDIRLNYDHFTWEFNHAGIVKDLSEELVNWIHGELWDAGFEDVDSELIDTWSPKEYNFTTDGFEMEVTLDPNILRSLTTEFDVDTWVKDLYGSRDGFLSFIPGRMEDDEWARRYDGEFRLEFLFANIIDGDRNRGWLMHLAEAESEVYMDHVKVTPDRKAIREAILEQHGYMDSGYTLDELAGWAQEITNRDREGMIPLFAN